MNAQRARATLECKLLLKACQQQSIACRGSSYPRWLGSSKLEQRIRGQLCAAASHRLWTPASPACQQHWLRIVHSLPLVCDSSHSVAASPVVQLNCDQTLAAAYREGSKHLSVSSEQALFGRCACASESQFTKHTSTIAAFLRQHQQSAAAIAGWSAQQRAVTWHILIFKSFTLPCDVLPLVRRDPGGAGRALAPLQLDAGQSVCSVSWSAAKAGKLASCGTTSSAVAVWDAAAGRCDLTLVAGQRTHAGRVGLLALQTLRVRARFLHKTLFS
jgi:hypothetical protein